MLRGFPRLVSAVFCLAATAHADRDKQYVFNTTPQGELKIHVFLPDDWKASDRRPAILFLFGGGFVTGSPDQLFSKAGYFASRGMVDAVAGFVREH